ncbi:hypothetical protein A2U01_0102668, partial [Trifolium medium]|nr:hypothetical protein [Trifolium medium]
MKQGSNSKGVLIKACDSPLAPNQSYNGGGTSIGG